MNSMNEEPYLIDGGVHKDERGVVSFVNQFDLTSIKRMYFSENANTDIIRAWQGHRIESRWFCCVAGSFDVRLVLIDDWEKPSRSLKCKKYILSNAATQVLFIPPGYANGFRALEERSKLLVFSDYFIDEIPNDQIRFDKDNWTNWNK